MKKPSLSVVIPVLTAASAYAHGFVSDLNIAGTDYKGNDPTEGGVTPFPSVIRQISTQSPVKGAMNPSINCGMNATAASLNANANPGDLIEFYWRGGTTGGNNWPHNTGPIMTYMASCGDQTCDKYDSTQAKWFKIAQQGLEPDGNTWYQAAIMGGAPANITLPSNIAPGNYLIRHELISLQLGMSVGGAEFYPSCSQLTVGGSGTGKPQASELVSFPGAYNDNDPGIYVPNVYNGNLNYQFPGPPIASFIDPSESGSSGNSGTSSSGNSGSSSGNSGSSAGGKGGASGGSNSSPSDGASASPSKCQLKRPANNVGINSRRSLDGSTSPGRSLDVRFYPKHFSRAMRGVVFGKRR
ncbi:hypothetical protein NP233_g170 [Leucocoprinus birnbaumii]|uniref:lytic cellulose monooxygenase (C4-dehydrogenating) n=1 Tax=Leucocoprinus birnbaumii TaxID=56174 RepID=A0AAD5W2P0_9AGAR|nr:hypothetical protein NP233_g170 [Leucocoprinus birnbaumii]